MKLVAKSKNGKMLKVGNNDTEAKWYFMTAEVMKVAGSFNEGDSVDVETTTQQGSAFITKITKAGSVPLNKRDSEELSPVKSETVTTGAGTTSTAKWTPVEPVAQKSGYLPKDEWIAKKKAEGTWTESKDKGSDTNASIKRQAIAHATSRTLIGMQGILTPDNVEEIMEKVYKKYQELVG
jgi:hypothetical protein